LQSLEDRVSVPGGFMFNGGIRGWPLLKQIRNRAWTGTGEEVWSSKTRALLPS